LGRNRYKCNYLLINHTENSAITTTITTDNTNATTPPTIPPTASPDESDERDVGDDIVKFAVEQNLHK